MAKGSSIAPQLKRPEAPPKSLLVLYESCWIVTIRCLHGFTDLERQASVRAPFESDDASTIRPREANHTPDVPELSINPLIQHPFEEDLHTSRVYTRVRTHTSDISTVSTSRKSTAWSYWSRISLSDVSNVSVLNLLITKGQIYNSEHYSRQSCYQTTWIRSPMTQ